MRVLWITRLVPFPPFHGGDAIYTAHLVESLAAHGAKVTVLCHDNGGRPPPELRGVAWKVVSLGHGTRAGSLIRRAPSIVHRFSTPQLSGSAARLLGAEPWDAVLVDGLAVAGTVGSWGSKRGPGTRLVYLSHNHEESLRFALAAALPPASLARWGLTLDAMKAARIERELVDKADMVTTTTSADEELFRNRARDKRYLILVPGYAGPVRDTRVIDELTPRRVLLLGSFGWIAKQLNLRRFLEVAATRLLGAGIGIDVVGAMPAGLLTRLRATYPSVRFSGAVDDFGPFLDQARVGVIVEGVGGGFKLKILDYIFNRVPVLSLTGASIGTPLGADHGLLEFPDVEALVTGIIEIADDFDQLNALHETAFAASRGKFEWSERGQALANEIASIVVPY